MKKIDKKFACWVGLSIFLVLSFVFIALQISTNNKTEANFKEIDETAKNIRVFYQNKPNYWGLDTKTVIENDLAFGKALGVWGENLFAGHGFEGNMTPPASMSFDLAYRGMEKKDCIKLLSYQLDENQKISLVSISIEANDVVVDFFWGENQGLPISSKKAANICQKQNNILWTFK